MIKTKKTPLKKVDVSKIIKCRGVYGIKGKANPTLVTSQPPSQANLVFLVEYNEYDLGDRLNRWSDLLVYDGENIWICSTLATNKGLFEDDEGNRFDILIVNSSNIEDTDLSPSHIRAGVMLLAIECVNKWCADNENK